MFQKLIKKLSSSLTVRIFIITFSILTTMSALVYFFLVLATPISYDRQMNRMISSEVDKLITALGSSPKKEAQDIINDFANDTSTKVRIMYPDNTDYAASENLNKPKHLDYSIYQTFAPLTICTQFEFMDDKETYMVLVSSDAPVRNHTIEAMQNIFPLLVIVVIFVSLIVSFIYSKYITKPIVKLSEISKKMTQLDFTLHCNETRPDELGELGRNLDELSDRLSASLTNLKEANKKLQEDISRERETRHQRTAFFSAASHELKTPLTVIKGQLSGMIDGIGVYKDRDKYLNRSLMAAIRMERLVQEILTVSKAEESEMELDNVTLDFSSLVSKSVAEIKELANLREQKISAFIKPDIIVYADENLIQKAVSNILSNAVIHSPENSEITVTLTPASLVITNSGVHILESDLLHIFEPFFRVDESRNRNTGGSGMGLYIVKMILEKHDMNCIIKNIENGVESCIDITKISTAKYEDSFNEKSQN